MSDTLKCVSPVDGNVYVELPLATPAEIDHAVAAAKTAQREWRHVPVTDRAEICRRFVAAFTSESDRIAEELAWQMGRPITQGPGEVSGVAERASYMATIAAGALTDIEVEPKQGFSRFIRREPLGVVLTIAPWNYPYLTAVNSIAPAILSGNSLILKPSAQTPLTAERFADAFAAAGLPDGVFQHLYLSHSATELVIEHPDIDFVNFTGSVPAGRSIQSTAAQRFLGVGLELGGKDPAYVRADADIDNAVTNLVDGAFFNSGQSCCGIERIYVHEDVYDRFIDGFVTEASAYRLGDPTDRDTNLGPVVKPSAADFVREQAAEAMRKGARALIDSASFPKDRPGSTYLAPQVLVDVDHSMKVMTEESFGPIVGIMHVRSDDAAVELMNDSEFGLTASVWTADPDAAIAIGDRIETGTFFMNRCDYLDPALAWTGVKDSGRGCTLSRVGFEHLTRPKSYHLKTTI
ncbi:MAG: aldehyde dehydrogenase family protein [Alphaproteobacteria bacterium]|nr:aldehyde dehydrogenase family protein [Alphaproteobacteria bacterium]